MLGAVAVQTAYLKNCGELAACGVAGDADGHGDVCAGLVGEGDEVLGKGRVKVSGSVVKGHFVPLPRYVLSGRDRTRLPRCSVHACCAQEQLTGFFEISGLFRFLGLMLHFLGHGEEGCGISFENIGWFEVVLRDINRISLRIRHFKVYAVSLTVLK